ncbi:MAG: hypothetical protein IPK85_07540 [Gemmatimonadetes bacterium]|nr:hypothetical protein [Gemmatimonadota bacterium]
MCGVSAQGRAQVSAVGTSIPTLSAVAAWNVRADSGVSAQANSITLLITSGATQSIGGLVDGAINTFASPVRLSTQWSVTSLITSVDLVGYFAAPASALSNGSTNLGSSLVEGRMTTGRVSTFTPFTQGPVGGQGVAGGTLHLFRQLIIAPFNGVGQRNDQLDLRLNLQGQPVLPTGTYQGTLTLRATVY